MGMTEVDVSVCIKVNDDGSCTITHYGACKIEELHFDDQIITPTSRCCEYKTLYKYQFKCVDTIPDLEYDGNSETLANNPYPWSGDVTTDQATLDQLVIDFQAGLVNLGVTALEVTGSLDIENEVFTIDYITDSSVVILSGSTQIALCDSYEDFYCA